MTIEREISGTVYTRLVTTTSILAKLVVCAILLASIVNAQAANDQAANDDGSNRSGISRRSGVHAAQNRAGAKLRPIRNDAHSNLSELEREWQRLHSDRHLATLRKLVACGELGECDGLKLASQ